MRFFGTLLEVKESEVRHELEINKQRDIERQRKKEHKYLEKLKKEKEEHNQYYNEYCKDPTSVMICPFGWSP